MRKCQKLSLNVLWTVVAIISFLKEKKNSMKKMIIQKLTILKIQNMNEIHTDEVSHNIDLVPDSSQNVSTLNRLCDINLGIFLFQHFLNFIIFFIFFVNKVKCGCAIIGLGFYVSAKFVPIFQFLLNSFCFAIAASQM